MPEEAANGSSFTNKEMWVRVDAKLDTLVARQQNFDVEMALLKEKETQVERRLDEHIASTGKRDEQFQEELNSVISAQEEIVRRLYAAGAVLGFIIIVANIVGPWVIHHT